MPSGSRRARRSRPRSGCRHCREHLCHQLAARSVHDGVAGSDDEVLGADVGLECEPATLGQVARVDVAPEIPAPQARVVPKGRKPVVVVRFHDVRKSQCDVRRAGPAMQLSAELLREHFRQRVARFGIRRVFLVDRRVCGLLALERQAEDRLARRPHDPAQPEQPSSFEHVVGAEHVRAEGRLLGVNSGRRYRCEVNDRLHACQAFDGLAKLGQVGQQKGRK